MRLSLLGKGWDFREKAVFASLGWCQSMLLSGKCSLSPICSPHTCGNATHNSSYKGAAVL